MATSDERLMNQLVDSISSIERELARVRSVVERRVRGLQSERRRRSDTPRRNNTPRNASRNAFNIPTNRRRSATQRSNAASLSSHEAHGPVAEPSAFEILPSTNVLLRAIDANGEDPYSHLTDEELIRLDNDVLAALYELSNDDGVYDEPQNAVPVRIPKLKVFSLKAADLNALMHENCAICQDKHVKVDTIQTSCKHCFGKECFMEWVQTKLNRHQTVTCPLCLTASPNYWGFRPRKPIQQKQPDTPIANST